MKLYALLDKTSGLYGGIMMGLTDAWMCRQLQEQGPSTMQRYPDDFDLYEFGDFSDDGRMDCLPQPRKVCNMSVVFGNQQVTEAPVRGVSRA